MKALLIDDSRATRLLLGRLVRDLGFETVEASDGLQGLEVLRTAGPIDLILVDWNMPELDGLGVVRAVRALPEHSGVRLLLVSAESDPVHVVQALTAGADGHLAKPFTREGVAAGIRGLGFACCA
jgi:two-component system chemotaxis response regulator CheY